MKSMGRMAAVAIGALLLAEPAAAADYQGLALRNNGSHVIKWNYDISSCRAEFDSQTDLIYPVIDGQPYSSTTLYTDVNPSYTDLYIDDSLPYTTLNSATVRGGADHITCGTDRLLLPGAAVAPPPAPVPTLSEWAMILLGVMLAGGAALTLHRRRTA